MPQCFAPDCNHQSESHYCHFFGFPSKEKKPQEYKRWLKLLRREDREPSTHSRVCSCHFRNGEKCFGPKIYARNAEKIFPSSSSKSREKNEFSLFTNCRIIVDCTDIEVARPSLMSNQSASYSTYRGMNSFKVLVGVAPNGVITFVSSLYPGSILDKEIVNKSGLLSKMETGDLIVADKGFLIHDMVPSGFSVNIPPFLQHGKFTESKAAATKNIARCRIHVERVNARLKDFKILGFVPPYLRSRIDTIFQLCAALVNLQLPLIKECCETTDFD
eukprot:gene3578-12016_t